jgi:hypothetical protein
VKPSHLSDVGVSVAVMQRHHDLAPAGLGHTEPDKAAHSFQRRPAMTRVQRSPSGLCPQGNRESRDGWAVGQVLRYMGWVKYHLAASGERVEGMIIARQIDEALQYALSNVSGVEVQLYEVDFRLIQPSSSVGGSSKRKA